MLMNPEYFDIEMQKTMNMWPNEGLISRGIIPYLKRIRQDKIAILILGDLKGENAVDMADNVSKIAKINVVNEYDENPDSETLKQVLSKNINQHKSIISLGFSKKERDVVCFDESACTVDNLKLYYDCVKSGGIVCGNGHSSTGVRDSLTQFRRELRIGTPIQVSYLTTWFWIKR